MRLAVLADIHGNADALQAVLTDLAAHAPDAIVNLGDCFSGPLDAARTADLLAGAGITVTVRGNHDRWLLDRPLTGWEIPCHPQLSRDTLDWIASLPATATFGDAFLCHATPQDDLTYWMEEATPEGGTRRAPLAAITARAGGLPQSLLLCGHSHIARALRLPDGRLILNPGSVGCAGFAEDDHNVSTGHPFASYAILDQSRTGWSITQRLIPYDTRPATTRARAAGYPDWAAALATGWLA
jgi:predicted phosphodiesterase